MPEWGTESPRRRGAGSGTRAEGLPPLKRRREHDGAEEVLRAEIRVQFCDVPEPAEDPAWQFNADLAYRASDPYAVEVVFKAPGHGDGVSWVMARDLLFEGLQGRAGTGDVEVWSEEEPGAPGTAAGGQRTYIRLNSEEGTALLRTWTGPLEDFLKLTELVVAVGTEHDHLVGALEEFDQLLEGMVVSPGGKDVSPQMRGAVLRCGERDVAVARLHPPRFAEGSRDGLFSSLAA